MKKIRLLFQGDSITDAERNTEDYHDLGSGYARRAAELLKAAYPHVEFEFINLAVSESKTCDLHPRLDRDFIDIQPDIVSILIGVNDTWDYAKHRNWLPNEVFRENYRFVLEAIRTRTNARIMIMEPYLVPFESKNFFREDLDFKIDVIRELALEYADAYLPTDGLMWSELIGKDPLSYARDGVHPTEAAVEFLARKYVEYVSPIIEDLIK
ncbi:MAG: GDSL family lipase [Clostridia bacterium]|nr:GDSL family lipase [Clostridia bacterium]